MSLAANYFRVKVLVDENWVSTGDFFVLEQAKDRARLIAWNLGRNVEIRDQNGQLIHKEAGLPIADGNGTIVFEDDSRNTLALD